MLETITIEFTQDDLNGIAGLFDLAVKSQGIVAARIALPLIDKMEQAIKKANDKEAEDK